MDMCMSFGAQLMVEEMEKGSSSNNVVLSPMSIALVLNMLASGSNGQTLDQFLEFLGSQDIEAVVSKSKSLMSLLASVDQPIPGNTSSTDHKPAQLIRWDDIDINIFDHDHDHDHDHRCLCIPIPKRPSNNNNNNRSRRRAPVFAMANALWVDRGSSLRRPFQETSKSVYRALVKSVDFGQARKVRDEVNSWAKKETKGLIETLLSPETQLEPPLCVANALYFNGTWRIPFRTTNTRDDDFHLLSGETVRARFMTMSNESHSFGSFDGFKLLKMEYKQGGPGDKRRFSMCIFLPHAKDGLKLIVENHLDNIIANKYCFGLGMEELSKVWIPKMKFGHDFDAVKLMREKGLTLPFDADSADFTNMVNIVDSAKKNVYVTIFHHKACIEVNELGTEAAATSFAGLTVKGLLSASPDRPLPSFVADHPFMFMIVEDSSELVVLTGVVLNPLFLD